MWLSWQRLIYSGMVAEFANLQGIAGRYYALNDGEPEVIAEAIADHTRRKDQTIPARRPLLASVSPWQTRLIA